MSANDEPGGSGNNRSAGQHRAGTDPGPRQVADDYMPATRRSTRPRRLSRWWHNFRQRRSLSAEERKRLLADAEVRRAIRDIHDSKWYVRWWPYLTVAGGVVTVGLVKLGLDLPFVESDRALPAETTIVTATTGNAPTTSPRSTNVSTTAAPVPACSLDRPSLGESATASLAAFGAAWSKVLDTAWLNPGCSEAGPPAPVVQWQLDRPSQGRPGQTCFSVGPVGGSGGVCVTVSQDDQEMQTVEVLGVADGGSPSWQREVLGLLLGPDDATAKRMVEDDWPSDTPLCNADKSADFGFVSCSDGSAGYRLVVQLPSGQ